MSQPAKKTLSFWTAVSIGVGGMVGGGIFSVIGLAAKMSGGGIAVSFLVAGFIALLTSYSYFKLAVVFPSQGGTVEYLNQAFGPTLLTGGLNVLLCLSYVVMLALSAYAFASYGLRFFPQSEHPYWRPILLNGIVIALTLLNILSPRMVLKSENFFNAFKIFILAGFGLVGIFSIAPSHLALSAWAPPGEVMAAGMIIFLAFQGFELIANAAADVPNPHKLLPKAFVTCILSMLVLYIVIGIVVVGHLTPSVIAQVTDHALATTAQEFLGRPGYYMMAVAAVFATSSALNASLYGSARVTYILAKEGQVPKELSHMIFKRPVEGLIVMSILTLITVNFFDLNKLSTMGSAGFLVVYAGVNAANLKLHRKTKSNKWIPLAACLACIGALEMMVWYQMKHESQTVWVLVHMVALSFLLEFFYRTLVRRKMRTNVRPPIP